MKQVGDTTQAVPVHTPHRIEAGLLPRVLGAALKWSISWGGGGGGGEVGQGAHTIAKECN